MDGVRVFPQQFAMKPVLARRLLQYVAVLVFACVGVSTAFAQAQPVTLVVSAALAGALDIQARALAAAMRLVALDKNLMARFNVDWLRSVLVEWDKDPYGLMKKYTDDISRPMVANPNAPLGDDPKTVGRGTRGS